MRNLTVKPMPFESIPGSRMSHPLLEGFLFDRDVEVIRIRSRDGSELEEMRGPGIGNEAVVTAKVRDVCLNSPIYSIISCGSVTLLEV